VDPAAVRPVTAYHSAMGVSGARHSMFAADVDESLRTEPGGGLQCAPAHGAALGRRPGAAHCRRECARVRACAGQGANTRQREHGRPRRLPVAGGGPSVHRVLCRLAGKLRKRCACCHGRFRRSPLAGKW